MWIRSQDGEIIVDAAHSYIFQKSGAIYFQGHDRMALGYYGDRAMEVMDDIQAAMMRGEIIFSMPPKPEWGGC